MKYILPQKNINYCISRGYEVAEVWTKYNHNNITFVKLVPKEESLEIKHCWQAMGFTNTKREVYVSAFSSSDSILSQVGLINDLQWNSVYERIIGTAKDNPLGLWKHKPKGMNKKKEWLARDKNLKQRKWTQFSTLYDLCSKFHLNYRFVEKEMENVDVFCTNSGILIKKVCTNI